MNEADHFRKEILRMTQAVDEMSSHKEIPPRKTPYQKKTPKKTHNNTNINGILGMLKWGQASKATGCGQQSSNREKQLIS